jgi:hypothetical protein
MGHNKSKLRVGFVTFADGSEEFKNAGIRLASQALESKLFSEVINLNDSQFREVSEEWNYTAVFLESIGMLPYFYLGTKAWLIDSALEGHFGDFDIILYADAGCEILNNWFTRRELKKQLKTAMLHGGVAEQLNYPEIQYTKMNLIEYFNLSESEQNLGQVQATWSIWKNSDQSKSIVKKWVEISNPILNFWHNPEGLERFEQQMDFLEHRRDQSIFSILWKRNKYYMKSPYWEYGGRLGVIRGCNIPIHATRNRTGKSRIKPSQKSFAMGVLAISINRFAELIRPWKRHLFTE